MSHRPVIDCSDGHAMTGWGTVERTNEAGERCFVWERHCYACGWVEVARGAIVEVNPTEFRYTKILEAGSEPDD